MKKRFPTLVAIGGVILVFSLLFVKRACSTEPSNQDRDRDGIINEQDSCPDEYAKTPNGCPEEPPTRSGDDQDKDGFLGGFQKDTSILDRDDSDACIPNPTCDYCDKDGDGLTYPQEKAKRTLPDNPDSDGDGLNDKMDRCPLEYGLADNNGCNLTIDVNLKRGRNLISWNPELEKYAESIKLIVTYNDGNIIFNGVVNGNKQTISQPLVTKRYRAELIVNLRNARAVRVINGIKQW
jgi:hypothetical protein